MFSYMPSFDSTIQVLPPKRRYELIGYYVHHRAENVDMVEHGCEWCVHRAMGESFVMESDGKTYFIRTTDEVC